VSGRAFRLFAAIVVIQGVHMFEHVVQLLQVTVLGVPDEEALGLLGYVLQLQGTEEWLHIGFNGTLLLCLYLLLPRIWSARDTEPGMRLGASVFAAGVALETWHFAEHAVIISHVIARGGCPCPGIGDSALGVSDTVLHFFYNAVVYACMLVAFRCVLRSRGHGASTMRAGAAAA
jgi:hypothetical protein